MSRAYTDPALAVLTFDEIGKQLGKTGDSVQKTYERAIRKLRRDPRAFALWLESVRDHEWTRVRRVR